MPSRPGIEPPKRQSALIFATAQQLRQEPGPSTSERYAIVLELGNAIFAWTLYSGDADDGIDVIAPSAGPGTGRWKRTRSNDRGEDLPNADTAITVSGNRTRILPPSTLTANHSLMLDDEGAIAGDELYIVRNDSTAFTYTIVNGGVGAGNVVVMPASNRAWCRARFDGTDWIHLGSGIALASS